MLDDELGLAVGVLGEAGGHEGVGQLALLLVHVAELQAMAVHGRVVPEDALAVVVAEVDGRFLVGVQTVQQGQRGAAHLAGGLRVNMRVIVVVVMGVGSGHVAVLRGECRKGMRNRNTGDSVGNAV